MKEKSLRRVRNQEKMTTFAKNTAHNERRLLNFSYLCTRGGKSVADMTFNVDSREYMATIKFDRERFLQSIREYRQQKREWQERINKQLDAKEEEIRRIKASHYYEIA